MRHWIGILAIALFFTFAAQAAEEAHEHGTEQVHEHDETHAEHDENRHDEHDAEAQDADHSDHAEHGHEEGEGEHSGEEDEHDGHDEHDEHSEEKSEIKLLPEAIKMAGIKIEPLSYRDLGAELKAPGEVKQNSYLSSKVAPRITAQIVTRHARLGDMVKKGDQLITLSSVEMAEAAGELAVAHKEWNRVRQLGTSAVSAKRYSEAKISHEQALAKVRAYGMTNAQISRIHEKGITGNAGEFRLLSPQDGTVTSDDFIEGELVEPGRILFDIADESVLWVESQVSPERASEIDAGSQARVQVPGDGWLNGIVVQKHHKLDRETRTIGIRIEVNNAEDRLHPGMYVDTRIETGGKKKYLAVPSAAVMRSPDGDDVVYIEEEPGMFKPQEIRVVETVGAYSVIDGLPEASRIVTEGAFFVHSEIAKSGFEVHNH